MEKRTLRRWSIPALVLLLLSVLLGPLSTFVRGADRAELPLTEQYVTKYQGNYCVITKGASLIDTDSASFAIDVPGEPVAAFWNWSGRFIQQAGGTLPPATGDSEIRIVGTLGDGTPIDQIITATVEETSDPQNWIRWYAYFYSDAINQYVRQGSNSYIVSDFALPPGGRIDTHGVALTIVYESENCPLSAVEVDFGLDTLFWGRQFPYGPNSSVACVELTPSSEARTLDYTMIIAGVADPDRPNAIWVASIDVPGDGLPNNLVDEPFATGLDDVLGKDLREWDIYSNQLTIDPGDNYACFQIESPPGNRNPGGISAGWLSLNTTLELPIGSIGDLVWSDINGDGVKDPAEFGLAGVNVSLTAASGDVKQATTDGNGLYIFNDLPPDTYTVVVDTATGPLATGVWVQTGDPDGGFDNQSQVVLAAGEDNLDQDFGYQPLGSIGDTVWNDKNSNGAIDGDEKGIAGVTVTLSNSQGVVGTQVTDQNGFYSFGDLPADQYTVTVDATTLPENMIPTYDIDGIDTPNTVSLLLAPGEEREDVDFGYRSLLDILGDTVWNDPNGNGVQDPGEPGLNGVIVILTDSGGGQQTAVTNADGFYNFTELPAGTYTVSIDTGTLPTGYDPTYDLDGIETPNTTQVTLNPGQDRDDVDFGYTRVLGSIGDTVWNDLNGNGVQDEDEPGIQNVTVILTAGDSSQQSATTDENGFYTFDNLPAGQYVVSINVATLPENMQPTYDLDGIDTPNAATLTLETAEDRTDVDFGYQQAASLGDTVWNDANENGVQDTDEDGIGGVTLLLSAPGLVRSTVTDANGKYSFGDLLAGKYTVSVSVSTLPDGLDPTYDLDGIQQTPNTAGVILNAGQNRTDVDFGYAAPLAIDDGEPDDGVSVTTVFLPVINR